MRYSAAFSRSVDETVELLQQLADIHDDDEPLFPDQAHYPPSESDATASSLTLPFEYEELNADACDVSVYDPALFPPAWPTRGSVAVGILPITSDREKPLPRPPSFEYRPPPPPPTPTLAYVSPFPSPPTTPLSPTFSSASSSPRIPSTSTHPPFVLSAPRPRPKSTRMSITSSRSASTHSTFPSISSTLSHLEERESDSEKRSGVYVTDAERGADERTEATAGHNPVLTRVPVRKSSKELLKMQSFVSVAGSDSSDGSSPRFRSDPPTLSTSHSSPQLRTLADLATTPVAPIRTASPASTTTSIQTVRQHTLTRSHTFPADTDSFADAPLSPGSLATLSSRWSLDSTHSNRPILDPIAEHTSPESPVKPRKRDRLISFISRNRAGSIGKSSPPNTPTVADSEYADLVGFQPEFFVGNSKRSSAMTSQPSTSSLILPMQSPDSFHPPLPPVIAASASSSSSVSTLPTPVDGRSLDVLPRPSFFGSEPSSYLPELDDGEYEPVADEPLPPTLPLPSPSVPTASFLVPQRPQSNFPFLSTFRRKTRRHKKLVISNIPYFSAAAKEAAAAEEVDHRERERDVDGLRAVRKQRMAEEQKVRYDAVVRWCETFGALRRVEAKSDGSLHVHWKEWEAADMVCRIQGQVFINDVGTVSLTWHYLK